MRKTGPPDRRCLLRLRLALSAALAGAVWLALSRYVNGVLKPTVYELAEYQARASVTEAVNAALDEALAADPELCGALYRTDGAAVVLDTAAANRARAALVAAVQRALDEAPAVTQKIPVGSLTNDTLLGGLGPAWTVTVEPTGYVEGEIEEQSESLAVNTVRLQAVLTLRVTVNMILDTRAGLITVETRVPLASAVLQGETPDTFLNAA